MVGRASLVMHCPHCGKPCSCKLQGGTDTSWFTCPHCRARFYVQVTVGREASQAAPQRPIQVPTLRCLTEEFDWNNPQDFVRFAQAYEEDMTALARLKPGPVVEAARRQLEMMRFSVREIEGALRIQLAAVGINMLAGRRGQPNQ
jgi:hypothetical protein